jgi:outer membrane protein assembly factor BamE (lipoprotein component of BamABCDE complex)
MKRRPRSITLSAGLLVTLLFCSCATQPDPKPNPDLTQGNVQLHLVVGETTKAEVLEVFGAPNITTRDGSGRETWSYQRAANVTTSSTTGFWVVLVGGNATGFESSSRMMTLIIKFDENDIVADFRSRSSSF